MLNKPTDFACIKMLLRVMEIFFSLLWLQFGEFVSKQRHTKIINNDENQKKKKIGSIIFKTIPRELNMKLNLWK